MPVSPKNIIVPQENVCIDETLVPFGGRLGFRQYIKNKRHKFGISLQTLHHVQHVGLLWTL